VKRLAALVVVLSAVLAAGAVYATLPIKTTIVPTIELVRDGQQAAGSERPRAAIEADGDGAGVVIPEVVLAGEHDPSGPGSDDSAGADSDDDGGTKEHRSGSGSGGDNGDDDTREDDGGP
jgi:hypothetical protein